jgi:glycosyltransferase involved in cell wall biosynthesis
MKAFVIIPAYNEENNIESVIKKTKRYVSANRIIVIADGSRDRTAEKAEREKVAVLRHLVNLGKGAALKTGCEYALSKGADVLIAIDADGQHKPEDIPKLLKAMKGRDIVFTYRAFNSHKMPLVLKFGNLFIQIVSNLLFNIRIRDTQCGFRAFTREAYKKIKWSVSDYSVESEIIAKTGKYHLRFAQIPIETAYAEKYKGTTVIDGIRIVLNMLWWRVTR